jgi:hypothetical protein
MSQHDMDIGNANGAGVRADLNAAVLALVTQSSGATAPTTTFSYQFWADTTAGILKQRNAANSAWIDVLALSTGVPSSALSAKTNAAQSFTASQRGTPTTDNDLSFDLNATNNFSCTPTAGGTLTFTNIASAAGQSGLIKLVNGSNYAIAAHANTKVGTTTLATISATGTYLLTYFCDSTNVYVVASGSLS